MAHLLHVTFDLTSADMAAFEEYESQVLDLLASFEGQLLGKYRANDNSAEFHILEFFSKPGFDAFLNSPERQNARPLFEKSGAKATVVEVRDFLA